MGRGRWCRFESGGGEGERVERTVVRRVGARGVDASERLDWH